MSTSAAKIVAVPLGAGQEIGRSCVVVRMGGHSVMFDCGIHTAFTDERCFPRFDMLLPGGAAAAVAAAGGGGSGGGSSGGSASAAADAAPSAYAHVVDALVITHYHLDHVGALPHFVSVLGYRGPIFMTSATRGIAQTMLLDYVYVMRDRKQVEFIYTKEDLLYALSRVTVISLHERVRATSSLTLTPYYAGHVLGAVMVHAEAAGHSVVYTGDFNATADGHLGPAAIPPLRPHLLITESTYASSTRSSQKRHEDKFVRLVAEAVAAGGKVLVPVYGFGRAQELQLLLDTAWQERRLSAPIYFAQGAMQRANLLYRLYASWSRPRGVEGEAPPPPDRCPFAFKHVRPFGSKDMLDAPGACVLFATPGMLFAGFALEAFKHWAGGEANLVLLPSYCSPATVGAQLLQGKRLVTLRQGTPEAEQLHVRCRTEALDAGRSVHVSPSLPASRGPRCGSQHPRLPSRASRRPVFGCLLTQRCSPRLHPAVLTLADAHAGSRRSPSQRTLTPRGSTGSCATWRRTT